MMNPPRTHVHVLLWLLAGSSRCFSYQLFQTRIPNGDAVPHPCKPNNLWAGVGHLQRQGGGPRNPFGRDFDINGQKWDECLCRADSDGDGLTNGEELGDPECVWAPGEVPHRIIGLSHPGVCEPMESAKCLDLNADFGDICSADDTFSCPAVNETDVLSAELRLTESMVPARETTYMCQSFMLPIADRDHHLIAYEPIIDNVNVMHHMALFGCDTNDDDEFRGAAKECEMYVEGCLNFIGIWSVGLAGECFREDLGFRLGGTDNMRRVVLQAHWNNPLLVGGTTDSSGLRVYYTPVLRPTDSAVMPVGPLSLTIPPGENAFTHVGSCRSPCTVDFPEPIYFTSGFAHMHYAGRAMSVYIKRNGQRIATILDTDSYSYDNPDYVHFVEPVEMLPGDEIETTCTFRTMNKRGVTLYGDSTSDEMCAMFLSYYPKVDIRRDCLNFHQFDICPGLSHTEFDWLFALAEIQDFFVDNPVTVAAVQSVVDTCDVTSLTCVEGCADSIAYLRSVNHTCTGIQENLDFCMFIHRTVYIQNDFSYAMFSCEEWNVISPGSSTTNAASSTTSKDEGLCPLTSGARQYTYHMNMLATINCVIIYFVNASLA